MVLHSPYTDSGTERAQWVEGVGGIGKQERYDGTRVIRERKDGGEGRRHEGIKGHPLAGRSICDGLLGAEDNRGLV